MASNYTPQAGDVIESPDKRERLIVCGESDTLTYYKVRKRSWWTWMRWVKDDPTCDWAHVKPTTFIQSLVDDHGWTLVSRKEVQDGK